MMTKEQELKHRIAMISDDLKVLRKFIYKEGLSETFQKPTPVAPEALTHLNNIEVACDLNNDECLNWEPYNASKINRIIEALKQIDVDGETMEYIIDSVGMTEQMHRQLIMTTSANETETLLEEKKSL